MNPATYTSRSYILICITAIIAGTFISWQMRWLGDDIFITLRYVQNFVEGNGIVYNTGERVEGYTDFLWLLIVSFFAWLKFDAPSVTLVLGLIFSAATLIIFSIIGYRASSKKAFLIPFIPLTLVLNYDYNVWATSGLEVSFVSFLLGMAFF